MRITESKLREMIRSELKKLREASTGSTGLGGAKKKGFKSKTRKSAQSDYDTKSSDFTTKSTAYDAAVAAKDDSKRYRQSSRRGGYSYRSTPLGGWEVNPDWTAQAGDVMTTSGEKNTAKTAKTTASTTLDTEKAADLEKTRPKQKPPSGVGAGFGKGKTAGKGKGKKKKN